MSIIGGNLLPQETSRESGGRVFDQESWWHIGGTISHLLENALQEIKDIERKHVRLDQWSDQHFGCHPMLTPIFRRGSLSLGLPFA